MEVAGRRVTLGLQLGDELVGRDDAVDALGPQLRKSLFYSFKIFSISLSFVLLGILGILPPLLVLFAAYKLIRRWRKTKTAV